MSGGAPARVRPARREDASGLWALVRELAAYEKLEDRLTGGAADLERDLFGERPVAEALVAEREGRPVGYALHFPTYSTFRTQPMMWLEDLYVQPAERGRGTGEALLRAVAERALARGCWRLSWEVLDWNAPALGFYERLGGRRDPGGWFTYHMKEESLRRLASGTV